MAAVPEGYGSLMSCLAVTDATRAVDFYKRAFGVRERRRITLLTGEIVWAELEWEGSPFCVCDDLSARFAAAAVCPMQAIRQTHSALLVYSDRIEELWSRALLAGAQVLAPMEPQPWGEVRGLLLDPFGNQWCLARRLERLTRPECERRLSEALRTNVRSPVEDTEDPSAHGTEHVRQKQHPARARRQ
jgi:PhnB protein